MKKYLEECLLESHVEMIIQLIVRSNIFTTLLQEDNGIKSLSEKERVRLCGNGDIKKEYQDLSHFHIQI
jgi:hypothetical protein